jgi:hypothetical protein
MGALGGVALEVGLEVPREALKVPDRPGHRAARVDQLADPGRPIGGQHGGERTAHGKLLAAQLALVLLGAALDLRASSRLGPAAVFFRAAPGMGCRRTHLLVVSGSTRREPQGCRRRRPWQASVG